MDSITPQQRQDELRQKIERARGAARELISEIESLIEDQHNHAKETEDVEEMQRLVDAEPFKWLADAKHSMQTGLMFALRSVQQPTSF